MVKNEQKEKLVADITNYLKWEYDRDYSEWGDNHHRRVARYIVEGIERKPTIRDGKK